MAVRDCFTGALLTLLVVPGLLTAQELTGFGERPRMEAVVLDRLPVLDGDVLNDPAWQGMQPATGFRQIQPAEGRPASQKTEVYLGYSDIALYIGVIAWDDKPSGIIALGQPSGLFTCRHRQLPDRYRRSA
ncbi:MAG: hypothetical protein U5K38_02545 [Woeseiaceae bacterium]|nr:hypothetical protein [Woeseiaceae bacterium]